MTFFRSEFTLVRSSLIESRSPTTNVKALQTTLLASDCRLAFHYSHSSPAKFQHIAASDYRPAHVSIVPNRGVFFFRVQRFAFPTSDDKHAGVAVQALTNRCPLEGMENWKLYFNSQRKSASSDVTHKTSAFLANSSYLRGRPSPHREHLMNQASRRTRENDSLMLRKKGSKNQGARMEAFVKMLAR